MYEKHFEQLKQEGLIRNRFSRIAEAYISNIESFPRWADNKTMEVNTTKNPLLPL